MTPAVSPTACPKPRQRAAARAEQRPAVPAPPAYPMPRPSGDEPLSFGLLHEVGQALQNHGYPRVAGTRDLDALEQSLKAFIYGEGMGFSREADDSTPVSGKRVPAHVGWKSSAIVDDDGSPASEAR